MTKTFEELLKEKNYQVRGEQEREKLSLACAEFIEQDNKAMWYYDLSKDLEKHLLNLYNKEKIAKHSYSREVSDWEVKKYIENSEIGSCINKTEEQIVEIILKKNAKNYCEESSFTLLDTSRKFNQSFFNIKNFYGILRENYNLNPKDKLEVNPPLELFTKENFEENLKKGFEFEKKRYPKQRNNKFEGYIQKTKEEDFNLKNTSWGYGRNYQKLFAREYLWTLSNIPIAYTDSKNAIEFFEKKTGINISNSKEYKKLVF